MTFSTLGQSTTASLPRTSTVSIATGDRESGDTNQGLEPVSGSSAPKKVPSGVLIGVILTCILVAFRRCGLRYPDTLCAEAPAAEEGMDQFQSVPSLGRS
ncbi:hypothetical protein FA13DRAFT_1050069 [Coprinellus micaceus]|uniref:Uncharacterized protein n=1 Tax=Coprinellus micaceus TaxID=71717 RepID=A0A4Y7RLX1_COPMI|nr:hypothetical protein FA13DRAFT_1050069 [Coprinellus micaceus]